MTMSFIAETDIAVIGMSCRFPGANTPGSFWTNLIEGRESIRIFSKEELHAAGHDISLLDQQAYVRARGVLDNIEKFDASAFDMTPAEAAMIDPQHRLFFECAWEAMEDGGYDGSRFQGPIGVYGGSGANSYLHDHVLPMRAKADLAGLYQIMQANEKDFLATKTAYKLNLTGPAITVQTACSTSLVAVHCACQAIINGECDMALAGGVSIFLPQICGYLYQEGMILSQDGHCRAFDASANGTVMGSGAGVVLMKRLEDAVDDRDFIYGVIKGGAVNNDGAAKVGFAAPGVEGQIRAIREAMAVSGVNPDDIDYVETHGTATPMGDPVEIEALRRAFGNFGNTNRRTKDCLIGSVKTNIGHCDAASGIAGLIKTLLAVKNGQIPPSLHFDKPNPAIDFEAASFRVCTKPEKWENSEKPRIAGVSSFGMGGTNVHVIIQQAPPRKKAQRRRKYSLLPISAKCPHVLANYGDGLSQYSTSSTENELSDIAYTFQVGRRQLNHRDYLVYSSQEELLSGLSALSVRSVACDSTDHESSNLDGKMSPVITFMFPGQGSQYPGMGLEVYRTEKVFRDSIDYCAEILQPMIDRDLRTYITDKNSSFADELQQTAIAQPVLFSIEYSYAMLLAEWGIHPQSVIGHSLGEYVAACLAGIFTLPEALYLVAARGALMQRQPEGMTVAVMQSVEELQPLLNAHVSLAAVNGASCTLSGSEAAIGDLIATCTAREINHAVLKTSHAFHSSLFDAALEEFAVIVEGVPRGLPKIPLISNLTGVLLSDQEAVDPWYWARQLRHTVRFSDGLDTLLDDPYRLLLEVGPGTTLTGLALQWRSLGENQHAVAAGCHPRDELGCERALFAAVGKMWCLGVPVDWEAIAKGDTAMRIPLPTYPFERRNHWMQPEQHPEPVSMGQPSLLSSEQWFFTSTWKRLPQPEQVQSANSETQWILLGDPGPVSDDLLHVLNKLGCCVSAVIVDDHPTESKQLERLLNTYADSKALHLVYLPSLKASSLSSNLPEQTIQFTVDLARALQSNKHNQLIFCDILTYGVYDITGEEQLVPAHAPLVSLAQSISHEYSATQYHCHCRCIDCGSGDIGESWPEHKVEILVSELMSITREHSNALRGGYRWREYYEPAPPFSKDIVLRNNGTYLITGGLGDIGLAFSDYISRQFKVNLILTRKSPFPDPGTWAAWLVENGEDGSISKIIRHLMVMQERGCTVMTASADVSSLENMLGVINRAEERFGKIDGIIHGAGVTGGDAMSSYSDMSVEKFCKILSPKYEGYRVLREIMGDQELDFLIAMSSLSAILGGAGMGAYGGANAMMAAQITADNRNAGSDKPASKWLCVDWDGWRFTEPLDNSTDETDALKFAIPAVVGAEQLVNLTLRRSTDRIAVSTTNLNMRLQWWSFENYHSLPAKPTSTQNPEQSTVSLLDTDEEELLATIWRSVLGTPTITREDSFFSLGGNSLQITQVHSRLKEYLGLEFPLRHLFEAPKLRDMAACVRQHMVSPVQPEDGVTAPREEMEF